MKFRLFVIALLMALVGSFWWVLSHPSDTPSQSQQSVSQNVPSLEQTPAVAAASTETQGSDASTEVADPVLPGPVENKPKPVALAATEETPTGPELGEPGSGLTPVTVLENLRSVFRQYNLRFGANPVGDNSEITASLNGRNPRQVTFVNPDDGLRMNDRGELVDNWGTPFFFHQLSRTEMEIHSAGPDRKMWSQDDLVLK